MNGGWIKMSGGLGDNPAVFRLVKLTKLDKLSVIGRLWAFWAWADSHAIDGRIDGAEPTDIDQVCERKGFAVALQAVGWLDVGDGFLAIPKHELHNCESAKERAMKNARQAKWRQSRDINVDAKTSTPPSTAPPTSGSTELSTTASTTASTVASTSASTPPSTRIDKRREEGIPSLRSGIPVPDIDPAGSHPTDDADAAPDGAQDDVAKNTKANGQDHSEACPDCPQQAIVSLYGRRLPMLRQPASWDGQRAMELRQRWRECSLPSSFGDGYRTQVEGLVFWDKFLAFVADCPKLRDGITTTENGKTRTWRPTLDWLVTKRNFLKVIEGAYAE